MYITTFYSYKGGVGRTMAMVNVAVDLAQRGARVLMVDFDLEAPSLMNLNFAGTSKPCKGIVDYVLEYLSSGSPPELSGFVCESEAYSKSGGQIWIMPAGLAGDDYTERLTSINWRNIYESKDGYLLIENLKAQWQELLQPDYVLIDSRTGHNEVMGICTRQLPDAVCAVFVPNPQNLEIENVVRQIRTQEVNSAGSKIKIHFVASNIPYDDDERGSKLIALDRYRQTLGTTDLVEIHHDRMLALMGHCIFVSDQNGALKSSSLAREYQFLASRIRGENLEDRGSALQFLMDIHKQDLDAGKAEAIGERLQQITQRHGADNELVIWLARVRRSLGQITEAMVVLDQAIQRGDAPAAAYVERAILRFSQKSEERIADARLDLMHAIKRLKGAANFRETNLAVRLLATLGSVDWPSVATAEGIVSLPIGSQLVLTKDLDTSDEEMRATYHILRQLPLRGVLGKEELRTCRTQFSLAGIRLGFFAEVASALGSGEAIPEHLEQIDAFNLGMAMWGLEGKSSAHLFSRVLSLHESSKNGPNYAQCLAVSAFVCGRYDEALEFVEKANKSIRNRSSMEFSCWQYLRVSPIDFADDLDELRDAIRARAMQPAVLSKAFA